MDAQDTCTIQVWRYDPTLFAKNVVVDIFSLYLSLKDETDERVELAMQEALEAQLRWYQLFRPISSNIKVLSVINVINHATIIFPLRGSFLKYISFGVAPSNVECGRLEL